MILTQEQEQVLWITLNRVDKHNAFNESLLTQLEMAIQHGIQNTKIQALILKANGRYFSSGADLAAMQAANTASIEENTAQAQQLAQVLFEWHQCPKPTMVLIQGPAYGGALGFIAAADFAIASTSVKFCFSEAKLGLIPAIISPYILETIGYKNTKRLFLSAETFDSPMAQAFGLIDAIVEPQQLETYAQQYSQYWLQSASTTLMDIKQWLHHIRHLPIDDVLITKTAKKLAQVRTTPTAQQRLRAFFQSKHS